MLIKTVEWIYARVGFYATLVILLPFMPIAYYYALLSKTGVSLNLVNVTLYDLFSGAIGAHIHGVEFLYDGFFDISLAALARFILTGLGLYVICIMFRLWTWKKREYEWQEKPVKVEIKAWMDFKKIISVSAFCFMAWVMAWLSCEYYSYGSLLAETLLTPSKEEGRKFILKSGDVISAADAVKVGDVYILQKKVPGELTLLMNDDISQMIIVNK